LDICGSRPLYDIQVAEELWSPAAGLSDEADLAVQMQATDSN
jgi:hypothetical protein